MSKNKAPSSLLPSWQKNNALQSRCSSTSISSPSTSTTGSHYQPFRRTPLTFIAASRSHTAPCSPPMRTTISRRQALAPDHTDENSNLKSNACGDPAFSFGGISSDTKDIECPNLPDANVNKRFQVHRHCCCPIYLTQFLSPCHSLSPESKRSTLLLQGMLDIARESQATTIMAAIDPRTVTSPPAPSIISQATFSQLHTTWLAHLLLGNTLTTSTSSRCGTSFLAPNVSTLSPNTTPRSFLYCEGFGVCTLAIFNCKSH